MFQYMGQQMNDKLQRKFQFSGRVRMDKKALQWSSLCQVHVLKTYKWQLAYLVNKMSILFSKLGIKDKCLMLSFFCLLYT